MKKEDKVRVLSELAEVFDQYPNFYLTDMEALDAEKTAKLRRDCFKSGVKLVMVKNTILKRVLEAREQDYSPLYDYLKGNTSIMFAENANAPARVIKEFTKDTKGKGKPQLKAAYVQECMYLGADKLEELTTIKSREELLADVIALLQSPAKNVVSALQSAGQTICGVLKTLESR